MPCAPRLSGAALVSSVMPSNWRLEPARPRTAAATVCGSCACTVRNAAPSAATRAVARSTVLPISKSFASTKTRTPSAARPAGQLDPAREQELQPDLGDRARECEPLPERLGLARVRHVERHDQLALRFGFNRWHVRLPLFFSMLDLRAIRAHITPHPVPLPASSPWRACRSSVRIRKRMRMGERERPRNRCDGTPSPSGEGWGEG